MTEPGLHTAIDAMRSDALGAAVLADWLGSGGHPVEKAKADARAQVCESCPLNCEPNWWGRVKSSIAEAIKQHLSAKTALGLQVENEERLHMCRACGCANRLKVWCPLEHIVKHTPSETFQKFPGTCWIKKEIGQP